MSWALGIDFGTSRSAGAMATLGGSDDAVSVSPLELEGNRWISSAVLRSPEGTLVVGAAADNLAGVHPDRLERTPKRSLGTGVPLLVGGDPLDPIDAAAAVMAMVLAEGRLRSGGAAPDRSVLTHPVRWEAHRRDALRLAGERAGIRDIALVEEPVAAAIHYAAEHVTVGSHVAVYDLGGGTFDTAVLLRTDEGFEVIGPPGGDEYIGGEDFDHRLFRYFGEVVAEQSPELWDQMLTSDERRWKRAALDLLVQARRAKEALSSYTSTQVFVPIADRDIVVNRSQFEAMIVEDVERTVDLVEETVSGAGLRPADLASVFLVGGSSRIPLVATLVAERFGSRVVTRDEPKAVVALGAARLAATGLRRGNPSPPAAAAPLPSLTATNWAPPPVVAAPVAPVVAPTAVTVHPPAPALAESGPDPSAPVGSAPSPVTVAWRVALGEPVGQLCADGDLVVFGSPGGVIRAVETATGSVRWQQRLGVPMWAAPALSTHAVAVGSSDGRVVVLDRATGQLRWQVATGGPIVCAPTIVEQTVLVGNDAGHLLALDLEGGALRWDLPVGSAVRAGLQAAAGTAIVATVVGQVYAVDVASGGCRWGYRAGGEVLHAPALLPDRVVLGAGDGIVYGLRLTDGQALYGIRCEGACVTPVVTDAGLVGFADSSGTVRVHRADPGQVHTEAVVGGPSVAGVVILGGDDGFAVAETGDGELIAVELGSGVVRFRVPTGPGNRTVPVAAGRLVVTATSFGQLYGVVVPFR